MFRISCTLLALIILAIPALAQDKKKVEPRLVEGKFGKALDASVTPLAFAGDERYRTPPLTIECWARLTDKHTFNVIVSSDPKSSSRHWELYSYARTGHFAVYMPGYTPGEIVSKKDICDKKWHHLAATIEPKAVKLYVDGKLVHEQAIASREGLKPKDGPLSIGQALDGDQRIVCAGEIDDVRISRVVRDVSKMPTEPHKIDADTVALWRFDGDDKVLADPEWTPPPLAKGEAWERMTDPDWIDARLRKMDTGPVFNGTMSYQHDKVRVLIPKATAIRVGEKGEGGLLFDRATLRWCAGWTGGFLQHSDRRFGLLNTPSPAGTVMFQNDFSKEKNTAPIPQDRGRFNGLYMYGKRVVLSYTFAGAEVLESPWFLDVQGKQILTRSFTVGPTKDPIQLLLTNSTPRMQLWLNDDTLKCELVKENGETWLRLPASNEVRHVVVLHVPLGKPTDALKDAIRLAKATDLREWLKGDQGRYPQPLVTKGTIAKDDAPFVVDTLTVPYDNPHNALFFCTGLDFLPDGRIAMSTCHGDVWLVKYDDNLAKVEWKRFATGLYQPLGLKVIAGKIVVLERGQLTRLHDLNKDDEADFYENICNNWHTGSGEHSYDTCLETDSEGNFYFFKTGDTHLPDGGTLLRVSKDGRKVETFSTGFRHPIGLGVGPNDMVTGADQEGNWMPVTRVDIYKKGGFYGDMRAHHRKEAPKTHDGPLCWLPKDIDNSAGGQVWVPHDKFGLPKGQLLHFSYGRCKLYALLTQKVDEQHQAGAVDLGVKFLSGSARGRFNEKDGHLYLCGLNGWQTAAKADGCLQRVRYTGKPIANPTSLAFTKAGIKLGFARKLADKKIAANAIRVEVCNYRWTANYGSPAYSVKNSERVGTDQLDVESVQVLEDGKSVLIRVKELGPAMQVRIRYDLADGDGKALTGQVVGTIHKLAAE